jgi:hypothetical protein
MVRYRDIANTKPLSPESRNKKSVAGTVAVIDGQEFALTAHADTFIHFVVERHKISHKQYAQEPRPWTDDRVLQTQRFTQVFRV